MYGKEEYTNKCVELVKLNAGCEVQILVVDDASVLPYKLPFALDSRLSLLALPLNLGFTGASNAGILWAQKEGFDYVHLLNNDTEPQPDFIKHQLEVMEADPKVGICGSIRRYPDGRREMCGADLIRGHQYFAPIDMPDTPMDVNWLPLCSSLMRMDMIREIGILDSRFRNHCSDSDYCLQAKMRGWKVMLVPKSEVIHYLSVTTKAEGLDAGADQKLFLEKLAGLNNTMLMREMPLDVSTNTFGKLEFSVYTK